MKKFFFVAVIVSASLVSCKKNRTCSCTFSSETMDTVLTNTTKSEAQSKCDALNALATLDGGTCKLK